MAKAKQPKKADSKKKGTTGQYHDPHLWAPPYPVSKPDKDGQEQVFVRAVLGQDMIANGKKYSAGEQTIPAGLAHSNAHILSTPK